MNRSLLFVTFQYPPVQASSGLLRSLSFTRELTKQGWEITVLTSSLASGDSENFDNLNLLPKKVEVVRTSAFDAAKSFSLGGWYPGILEWPDRFSSWVLSATLAGIRLLRYRHYDTIFSTYPIASAHLVGYLLSRYSKKPWVADFRDPMLLPTHPDTSLRRHAHGWIEERTIRYCSVALFTNEAAKTAYEKKYNHSPRGEFHVIENGFDEEIFRCASERNSRTNIKTAGLIRIVHSGTLYPEHRDPEALLRAIRLFVDEVGDKSPTIEFVFRATGYDSLYRSMISDLGLVGVVTLASPISYVESVKEMLNADGLLLIQGSSCNDQIPAKIYEYFSVGKPILALTDPIGATASCLETAEIPVTNSSHGPQKIYEQLAEFIGSISSGSAERYRFNGNPDLYSREQRGMELHQVLVELSSQ